MINHLKIIGSDIDHRMIKVSEENAIEAGLGDLIEFKQMQVTDISTRDQYGVLVGNPPYGERLSERREVEKLYSEMGKSIF